MFERYTENARRTIVFARYEASQYGSPKIGTEHLLLALLKDKRQARSVLAEFGIAGEIRKELEVEMNQGPFISTSVELPLSVESKRILKYAAESADKFGHQRVDDVHLLLAIPWEDGCLAARILELHGVDSQRVRKSIANRAPDADHQ